MPDSSLPFRSHVSGPVPSAPEPSACLFTWTRVAEGEGSTRLVLAGELDLARRERFGTAVDHAQADSDRVLLDLEALTFIDCASLFVVFAAAEHGSRAGTALILLSPRGQVRRLLDLVGVPAGVVVLDQHELPDSGLRVPA